MSPKLRDVADSAVLLFNCFWFAAYGAELGAPRVQWTDIELDRSAVGSHPAGKPNQTHAYARMLAGAAH